MDRAEENARADEDARAKLHEFSGLTKQRAPLSDTVSFWICRWRSNNGRTSTGVDNVTLIRDETVSEFGRAIDDR
jgi:hypothetical protein